MKTLKEKLVTESQIKSGGYILYAVGQLDTSEGDCLKFKNFNDLISKEWDDGFCLYEFFKDENDLKTQLEKTNIDNPLKTGDDYCDIRIFKV